MRFVYYERGGSYAPGVLTADNSAVLSLPAALGRPVTDLLEFIRTHTESDIERLQELLDKEGGAPIPLGELRVVAPIRRPVHDIICVGKNYLDHIKEISRGLGGAEAKVPESLIYFSKRASTIIGLNEPIKSHSALDKALDYEAELAVVIGKGGSDIPLGDVEQHIFGYSVFNDVSARTLQRGHIQWYRGKSLDTFAAMGPAITHRCSLPFPLELDIRSTVNGEARQSSNTRLMMRGVAELVHVISQGITLEPGDIIATGTPSGVGMGFDPPRYLKAGDTVSCEIQGIGRLTNPVED